MPIKPMTFEVIRPVPLPSTGTEAKLMQAIETDGATSVRAVAQAAKMTVMGVMNLARRLANRGLIRIS